MSTYIMRWNPGISSSKIDDYRAAREKWPDGFQGDWSIYEWEDADMGDEYYMVRVGDGPNGVVYHGTFLSEPYEGEDWAGTDKKRHYVDITVDHPADPDHPIIPVEELEAALPHIVWRKGHSGELISEEDAEILRKMVDEKVGMIGK